MEFIPPNDHFKAAMRIAASLPAMLTREAKHAQQKAILRELAAGLKTGGGDGSR